ncbi:MAG: S1 RNA-binding domain-containing protein [Patescibacteria group bacterium]|nr:S1 RNA-binding domain-containing protein [Patescibacteria group bacterium]
MVKNKEKAEEKLTMAELLAQETYSPKPLSRGQVVEGKVIAVHPGEILVDVGAKAEGLISGRELETDENLAKTISSGDTVLVYVIQAENESGQAILSLKRASGERRWRDLQQKFDEKATIEVLALEQNRGGLIVDYFGVRGFIPSSHLSVSQPSLVLGKKLMVKIIELDRKANRFVLSEKEVGGVELKKRKEQTMATLQKGQVLAGKVTGVMPFGVFVELPGGVEGLVHISELAWERVYSPADLYKVGDQVKVLVLDIDVREQKINLSIKQLSEDPWQKAKEKYLPGTEANGSITKITPYGVFVRLEQGIDGLIHTSKIPQGVSFEVGQHLGCLVESLSVETRRLGLKLAEKK